MIQPSNAFLIAAFLVWLVTLVHAGQRRRWGWFWVVFFVFPGMAAYWLFGATDREHA